MNFKSRNVDDTYRLAKVIANTLNGGDIVLLNGDLGAGKTTFVKGIAKEMGIKENVTSPTFTLLKTYHGNKYNIVHVDAYRLSGDEFGELDDYLNDENVIFIEWSSMLTSQLINNALLIDIKYISKNQRMFTISATNAHYESYLSEIRENV